MSEELTDLDRGKLDALEKPIEITFETQQIKIPFDTSNQKDRVVLGHIQHLESEIKQLKSQRMIPVRPIEGIPNKQAKQIIINFIRDVHKQGITQVNMIDLVRNLPIPAKQIEDIMDSLGYMGVKSNEF